MENISTLASFTAGLLSFLSPCILPLIPAYLSFVSGLSLAEMRRESPAPRATNRVFLNALFFVLGFSFVFVSLGASATFLGGLLLTQMAIFKKLSDRKSTRLNSSHLGISRMPSSA